MKCIVTKRTYGKGSQLASEELIAESRDKTEVIRIYNKLKMTVDIEGHYRITNGTGGTIRQGLCADSPASIFAIVDSCDFDTGSMELVTPTYSGTFEDYEKQYGHNRVERTKKRNFYVYTETTTEEGTGFGITEVKSNKTYAIYSLYLPEYKSRTDKARYIVKYIYDLLAPTEFASIRYNGLSFDGVYSDMYGHESIKAHSLGKESYQIEQARLLYYDAMERKTDVIEEFKPGIKYKPQGLFRKESEETTENEN